MKTIQLNQILKLSIFPIFLLSIVMVNAQQTTGDIAKKTEIDYGTTTTGGSIRLIDNKGTIKYLQSENGITMLTNTTDNVTTTTWQLGGTLAEDTFIDVDSNVFGLDGLAIETGTAATAEAVPGTTAAGEAGDRTDHGGTGSGWTLLVRDESTGDIKKLLAADLLESGQEVFTVSDATTVAYALTGSPILPDYNSVWVYRNGAKLIANLDYTIAGSTVTLVPQGTSPTDWQLFVDDVIEVHFVK